MAKKKYFVDYIGTCASRISIKTDIAGYTEGILEPFFPTDEEMEVWTDEQHDKWQDENNARLEAICKFLNENNL